MDKNINEIQDLFNSELMTNSIPISNPESLYGNNNQNIINESKKYIEDIIPKENKEIKESKMSSVSKMFDINNKIFSDDDMSLNKSNKLIKQNNNNNIDINNKNNISSNSLLLSLNINEIQLDENYDIKKLIPSDIYNYIRCSGNQLINNTKEGLKKLFIYLSDSLNNQKKINGSNDYYYNNDLNSENLLKIYIYIINIINKNDNKHDIINESLFIINLILPLLPTLYINNICIQLIEKFYFKTAFDDLNKNNYLLFKQILRLNQETFFDKIFEFLKKEKNIGIKKFWKNFIVELIQKNNENCGVNYYLENNENIINILNEYHKENLVQFCLDLFDYNDLNEINANQDAIEFIKSISENKILNNDNDKDNISFKQMILDKSKDNESLNLIIKNIFDKKNEYSNKEIKKINLDDNQLSSDFGVKNNLNSGTYFLGSFGTFNQNKNNNFENIINMNNNIKINNENYEENKEKYKNNEIFEIMDNNIIDVNKDNEKNDILGKKSSNKNKESTMDNINLYSDKEEIDSFDENNNININSKNSNNKLSFNLKKKNSEESMVNYKFSISNKDVMNNKNQKNEKKSINNNKNASKRTSKISEYYEYFNKRDTTNNNIFSSFSSISSNKRNSVDIKQNINDEKENNEDNCKENNNNIIMDNNNFLNIINNNKNINNNKDSNEEININNNINKKNKDIEIKINNEDNIINNANFLDLINNNKTNIKTKNNEIKKFEENNIKINNKPFNNNIPFSFEKKGFDYENCLNIIDKEKWNEKQQQIKLLKNELDMNLTKENYNTSEIPMDSIIELINKKLNDKQQKLVILILEIVEIIINKLNDVFNDVYLPLLSKNIINNLNDNNIQLRYKAATVILKILSFNKKEFFINELIDSLKVEKNNMRIEILTILTSYFSRIKNNTSSKKINKNYFELLIEPLILCIEDKFNKIRNLSEELIKESIKYIPIDKYYEATKHLYNKVVQDKVNSKIREIYGLEDKNDLKKSNKSISSILNNSNDLIKSKKHKERSKSVDICNNNKKYVKKNINKYKKNTEKNNNTINNNKKYINDIIIDNEFDYKNVFKKNQNFIELKKYRNNKDIKLGKNFLSIKEKSNILINNQNFNSNNSIDIKPLFQIFTNEFINQSIIPYNRDLTPIIIQLNKVLSNIQEKMIKSDFLPNLDIILEFLIRLFDHNLINKKLNFISEYISFINNLYEKLEIQNTKLTQLEYNLILHSLIYLAKYDKNPAFNCIKKFYKIISIERTFRIILDYNDLKDIDTQKNIIELFKTEIIQGNIDIKSDNFLLLKKIIKFFYEDELIDLGNEFFKDIYNTIGDKTFEEFISKLNKQEKNIFLKHINFFPLNEKKDKVNEIKKKSTITNFTIDLTNMDNNDNKIKFVNKDNNTIIKEKKRNFKLTNKDNNTIIEKPKLNEEKKEINNINDLKELLIKLNSSNEEFDIELYNQENDINNNKILSIKFKSISTLKNLFEENNYQEYKYLLIPTMELILDSLSSELNFFLNINTMIEDCSNNLINYIQELISIFLIISSKSEIIMVLKEDILNKLIILFLNYLEIDKEEEISEINDSFNTIIQKLNKITLNIIQKGKRELIIVILIRLISNFKGESDVSLLAINCLVQLIKITNFKKYNIVDILTEIIIAVDDDDLFNGKNNKKINELFLKCIKKLLNQLVIEKKSNILKDYQMAINRCNIKDVKVSDWIQKILEHNKFI